MSPSKLNAKQQAARNAVRSDDASAQSVIPEGIYKIVSVGVGEPVRSTAGIFLFAGSDWSGIPIDPYEWEVRRAHGEDGAYYTFKSVRRGDYITWANDPQKSLRMGEPTEFRVDGVDGAGAKEYNIKLPNVDLEWSVEAIGKIVNLEHAQGSALQLFRLVKKEEPVRAS